MSFSPLSDTSRIAEHREARQSRIAAPLLCRERVLRAVSDAVAAGETMTRQTLAEDFDVDPNHFGLRRILCELAAAGLVVVVPDEAGYDPDTIRLSAKTRRRAA